MEIRLTDEEALGSLISFAKNHRAAITSWAAGQYEKVTNPADRASFALEVLENYIAAIEELEMLYFALRAKGGNQARSLLEHYFGVHISEEGPGTGTRPFSAAEILRQIAPMGPEEFAAAVGLPSVAEYVGLLKGKVAESESEIRTKYFGHLTSLRLAVQQAVSNRSQHKLMRLYNMMKHGFFVCSSIRATTALSVCNR